MSRLSKREQKDKKHGKVTQDCPYQVDQTILAQNKSKFQLGGEWKEAKIIELKVPSNSKYQSEHNIRLYIHYLDMDRRWDEWVSLDRARFWERQEKRSDVAPTLQHDDHQGFNERAIALHEEATKFKTIDFIEIGKHRCETWYFSPFPDYYQNVETLYICEFCLVFFKYRQELTRHEKKCKILHPIGNEIYREGNISVFEVDGARNNAYCENLCYISKLFLDHKLLSYDIEPFLFYVLTEVDELGCHIAGYFSKEKELNSENNLSCILVFPFMQRRGFGKFLITFSYELSKVEQRIGTPERPLSDLGFASYFSWWAGEIIKVLESSQGQNLSISDIVQRTYIMDTDVIEVLEKLNLLRYKQGNRVLYANPEYLNDIKKIVVGRPGRHVYPEKLHWTPLKIVNG